MTEDKELELSKYDLSDLRYFIKVAEYRLEEIIDRMNKNSVDSMYCNIIENTKCRAINLRKKLDIFDDHSFDKFILKVISE